MRRVFAGAAWLALLAGLGVAAVSLITSAAAHTPAALAPDTLAHGSELGCNLFILLLCFGVLPGVRRRGHSFGALQGVWGIAGFCIMLAVGGLLFFNLLMLLNLSLRAVNSPLRASLDDPNVLAGAVLCGEIVAAAWVAWTLHRLGTKLRHEGAATGIAWRGASKTGYLAAGLMAAGIILLVLVLYHLSPPNAQAIKNLPMAHLFDGSAWTLVPLMLTVTLLAPFLEELVFRGIGFAGLAVRFGPLKAGIITTLLFMLVHSQEKLHYLPGFIDVGMMAAGAAWLRLRFASIRPAILLHILYNAGLMLASSSVQ